MNWEAWRPATCMPDSCFCEAVREGVIAAAKEVQLKVPLIVRLEGTNVELGKEILRKSGLAITPADNLRQAAEKAVAAVKGGHS